ncbi:MAG: DUF469 family protein [Rubrivivax sp.]|nr:DUF469 family protein [Rubrivivax sp.]
MLQPIVDGAGATSFWHAFVTEAIEALSLTYGGGEHGFVGRAGVGSATEADREMVAAWLHARPDVASFVVGPLVDAEPLHGKR